MGEVNAEVFAAALEVTKGTAVTTPTHILPFNITLDPEEDEFREDAKYGTYHETYRSEITRWWSSFSGEMGLDTRLLPFLLNIVAKGGVTSPTTPVGATTARLWEFVDSTGIADLRTATLSWGDPTVQIMQSAYGHIDDFTITADGEGTDGTMMSIAGAAQMWTQVAAPTYPSMIIGPLIFPNNMQVFLDNLTTGGTIGSTSLLGRVTKIEHSLGNNLSKKFPPTGPTAGDQPATISRLGRGKRALETAITMEVPDASQLTLYKNRQNVALRVRHNGPEIETGFRHYAELDTYGYLRSPSWGEYESTNRTITFVVRSVVNTALGSGWRIAVQNDRTTL